MEAWLVLLRTTHFAATLSIFGIASFGLFVLRPALCGVGAALREPNAFARRLRGAGWISLALWLVTLLLWLLAETTSMSGQTLADSLRQDTVATVLARTQFGQVCLLRLACGALAAPCLRADPWRLHGGPSSAGVILLILGAVMLASLTWTGHAGAMRGWPAVLHLTADSVHLLAAGVWLGGLPPLAMLYGRRARGLCLSAIRIATGRFSTLGLICVGGIAVSGIANAWFTVGTIWLLFESAYGRLVLAKILLFAVMVGIAAVNRLILTPRLFGSSLDATSGDAGRTVRRLRRNAIIEAGLGLLVLAVVGLLGLCAPPTMVARDGAWPSPERPRTMPVASRGYVSQRHIDPAGGAAESVTGALGSHERVP